MVINKYLRGGPLKIKKSLNSVISRINNLTNIELAAERYLDKLAKLKILKLDKKLVPKFIVEQKKQAIRDARNARSAASKAELEWMTSNPDKATKVYKSGTREFGGEENKATLLKIRKEAMLPFILQYAKQIRNRRLGLLGALGGSALAGAVAANVIPEKKASPLEELLAKRLLARQGVPEKALKGLTIPDKPVDRLGNLTPECATYVNTLLRNMGINAGGDAYQMGRRYKDFVNGYDGIDITPNMTGYTKNDSIAAIRNMHHLAADNLKNNLDTLLMRKNHVYPVNMYYNTSPHMIDFYNQAIKENTGTPATHVGYAYWDGLNWRVTHNIHGKIHNDLLKDVLGGNNGYKYGITSMRDAGAPKGLEDE